MTLQVKMFSKALCSLALIWYHAVKSTLLGFLGIFCSKCLLVTSLVSVGVQIVLWCIYWTYDLCLLTCNIVCFSVGCYSDVIASYTTGCTSLLSVEYSQSNTLVSVGVTWRFMNMLMGKMKLYMHENHLLCIKVCSVCMYLCMHVLLQLVFHAKYNISNDINMF
jgi:hypothetical protein